MYKIYVDGAFIIQHDVRSKVFTIILLHLVEQQCFVINGKRMWLRSETWRNKCHARCINSHTIFARTFDVYSIDDNIQLVFWNR